ncbi:MAG TPA: S46 family peptidase [Vicinamibacterales bacterium]|nr:S46 family peptidase [Vicinamibacterales bacterium]
MAADEGMWTFHNPPTAAIQQRYGFALTPEWLEHLRLASVRLNDGGSGSFVSAEGLVLTNHHVVAGQLQKLSTAQKNYLADGFSARTRTEEIKATDLEVNVLTSYEEVTERIVAAARNAATPQAAFDARRAAIAQVEKDSLDKTGLRSDVVTLYQGAQYWLYRYRKFTDVRLVFAPEQQMAFFGGDPDNFTYPRYDLDFALVRVYENDAPLRVEHFLKWNAKGASENELVFVSGHPGSTDRNDTLAELETQRDVVYPYSVQVVKRRLTALREYSKRGAEEARQASDTIFGLENALKAQTGEYNGLLDQKIMGKKASDERALRETIARNAEWQKTYGPAWDEIARAETAHRQLYKLQRFGQIRGSGLAGLGLAIVRYVREIQKPDGGRLNGYHEAQLPSLQFQLLSSAPVYPAMEEVLLADAFQESLEELGAGDAFVKAALAGHTPQAAAAGYIKGTALADPAVRKRLMDGGEAAVNQSEDPLIVLGRAVDGPMREINDRMEREVLSIETAARQRIGQARFAAFGTSAYPDATFTLRLSYGRATGYPMNGTVAPYKTTFAGLYDRSASFDGKPPFNLPARFVEAKSRIELSTPFNMVTTNDIIGGNSGSPIVNRAGELVGLIFDGNIESLVGRFVYDDNANRAIAVHSGAIVHALRTVYDAGALANELESPR